MTKVKRFINAAGSVISLYPSYVHSEQLKKSDMEKLAEDWQQVGNDLWKAIMLPEKMSNNA